MTMIRPNFSRAELACKHCGELHMPDDFLDRLQELREAFGAPLRVTSGYRCPDHNAAVSGTGKNGPHTTGRAVDIAIHGRDAYRLVKAAQLFGFTGIGLKQHGPAEGRFIHLDDLRGDTRPWVWTY